MKFSRLLALLLPALFCTLAAHATDEPATATATLERFIVRGKPINSFGFDIHIYVEPDKKIRFMLVGEVYESGAAAGRDLLPGDEIVKINGRSVKDFERVVSPSSALGKLLLYRHPGDTLELEIVKRRAAKLTLRIEKPIRIEPLFPPR